MANDAQMLPKDQAAWQIYQKMMQTSDPAEAERLAVQGYNMFAQDPPHPLGLATLAYSRGLTALGRREPAAALPFLQQAADFVAGQPPSDGSAQVFASLGRAQQMLAHLPEARQAFEQSLAVYRQIGDALGQANQQFAIGQVLRPDPQAALPYFASAAAYWGTQPPGFNPAYVFTALADMRQQLGQLPQAAQAYSVALDSFRHMNEWQNVFARLIDLGTTYYDQRQAQPALTALNEAISIAEDKGDEPKLGQALILRGAVRQVVQQEYDAALADFLRLTQFHAADDQAYGWLQASGVYGLQNQSAPAIAAAQRACDYYQATGNSMAAAECQSRLGDNFLNLRQFDKAEAAYQQALVLNERAPSPVAQVQGWLQLAALAWARGQSEAALVRYGRGLSLAIQLKDARNAASCCEGLANVYEVLDLHEQAATYFSRAAQYRAMLGDLPGQVKGTIAQTAGMARAGQCAGALAALDALAPQVDASGDRLLQAQLRVALSDLAAGCGDAQRAAGEAQAAQILYIALGLPQLAAANAVRLGQADGDLMRWPEAQAAFSQALEIAEQHQMPDQALTARVSLAWAYFREGRLDEARASLQRAGAPAADDGSLAGYTIHIGLGVLDKQTGDAAGALAEFEQALARLDQFRLAFAMPDLPIAFIGGKAQLYQQVVRMLWQAGRSLESYARAEEARSRALLVWLGHAPLPPPAGMSPAAAQDEAGWLQDARRALSVLQRDPFDSAALDDLRQAHQKLSELWAQLGPGEYTHLRQGEPITWPELQACLSLS